MRGYDWVSESNGLRADADASGRGCEVERMIVLDVL